VSSGSLARRYARAALEVGEGASATAKLAGDLRSLAAAMKESPELVGALTNPGFQRAERRRIVEAIMVRLGAHHTTKNLVSLLLDNERIASLPAISRELDTMIEARSGQVTAEVVSAKPLSAGQLAQLKTSLEKLSGKKVSIERRTDPELLGGVVAKIGDVVYDGSLKHQLANLRDHLSK
jgi:F-type H+-transporting ATPase subunit delta